MLLLRRQRSVWSALLLLVEMVETVVARRGLQCGPQQQPSNARLAAGQIKLQKCRLSVAMPQTTLDRVLPQWLQQSPAAFALGLIATAAVSVPARVLPIVLAHLLRGWGVRELCDEG